MTSSNEIFREYDIRGRYPDQLNEAVFYRLGEAVWQVFKVRKIAIGRDARLSSKTLFLYLAAALKTRRVKVVDLGVVSTPFVFWYSQYFGMMALAVTASHNPKNENGLKLFSPKTGIVDRKSGLAGLKRKFEKAVCAAPAPNHFDNAVYKKHTPLKDYVGFILSKARVPLPGLKIAVDFSNGSAAAEFVSALDKLKVDSVTLNEKPNGNFPGHGPNPLAPESQRPMRFLVKSKKVDVGAVVDGDGDRILFFDERGEAVDPGYILSLLIDFCSKSKGVSSIVKGMSVARVVDYTAAAKNIKTVIAKVGRTNVQRAMKKHKAALGGEKSGHYFFRDFYYGDNALLALLWILRIMAKEGKPLSKLLAPYKKYIVAPEVNLPFEGRVDNILSSLREKYKNGKISAADGLTVEFPDWRFNLRRSHTEKVWRLNLEGLDKKGLEERKKEIEEILSL